MKNESEKPIEKIVNTQLNCRIFSRAIFQKIGQDLQTSGVRTDQVKVVNILRNTIIQMGNFIGYSKMDDCLS